MDTASNASITVIPTGAALAADVAGVDLSQPMSTDTTAQIRKAWNDHLVLRFRAQQLDDPSFLKFARLFGELDKAPTHAGKDVVNHHPEVGDLIMRDNRSAMHRRDSFDPESRRLMHRTQIKGGKPFFDAAAA